MKQWIIGLTSFLLFSVVLFGARTLVNPKSTTSPVSVKAENILRALECGDYQTFRQGLPKDEAKRYGMTEIQLKTLFANYLVPVYKTGTGEYQHTDQGYSGTYVCGRLFDCKGVKVPGLLFVTYRQTTTGWGYWADLNSILANTWMLKGAPNVPFNKVAKSDRNLLESYGLTRFPSSVFELWVSWDQQLVHLDKLAEKNSKQPPK